MLSLFGPDDPAPAKTRGDEPRRSILDVFGARPAAGIEPHEWQAWADDLAADGLSQSRIKNHIAAIRAVYSWASYPTRKLVPANPVKDLEINGKPSVPRDRAADAEEAVALLATLNPKDRVAYAIAFYAGPRKSAIARLDWRDVPLAPLRDGADAGYRLRVQRDKSEAGKRWIPIAEPLRAILLEEWARQGRPLAGPVVPVSMSSGRLADRADAAWEAAGLERITLHECRHTYVSWLVAAGYTLPEIMEYVGHESATMVQRYTHRVGPRDEANAAAKLNAYLRRADAATAPAAAAAAGTRDH